MSKFVVTASSLNLRKQPQIADNILGTLDRGSEVSMISKSADGLWLEVNDGQRVGWSSAKYLVSRGSEQTPVVPSEEFPWMAIAVSELGVAEVPGPGDNPRIQEYLRSTDLDRQLASNDETPWCSGFVNWCIEKAGYAGTNSARARSWLHWGKPLTTPRRGCITVFTRDGGGHVAFYVGETTTHYVVLGGNQGNRVCVANYEKARLLGFRLPS